MPGFGVHAMVWVDGWSNQQAERAISSAAKIGYDLVEIPLFDPEKIDLQFTREVLERRKVRAGVSLGLPEEADISSTDAATVARGAALLLKVLVATAALGGDYLGGVIFSALKKYNRAATAQGRANSIAVIRELAQEAHKSGVTIGLEAVNRYETNLLNTAAQVLRFCDAVGEPNVMAHLDTFHMNIEEADGVGAIELCGDRLGYFHVNESHRGYLGSGSIAFPPLFRALKRIGFDRTIAFEAFSSAVTSEALGGMAGIWRDLWRDSDDIADHALKFMRREFADATRTGQIAKEE
jgi:D-psicose/D-tagatose/L-ribulose 3-epimerase